MSVRHPITPPILPNVVHSTSANSSSPAQRHPKQPQRSTKTTQKLVLFPTHNSYPQQQPTQNTPVQNLQQTPIPQQSSSFIIPPLTPETPYIESTILGSFPLDNSMLNSPMLNASVDSSTPHSPTSVTRNSSNYQIQNMIPPSSIALPPIASIPEDTSLVMTSPSINPATFLQQQPSLTNTIPSAPDPVSVSVLSSSTINIPLHTEAELLPKDSRKDLPRVTCYCAADSYNIDRISSFLETSHKVSTIQYDECLYVAYEQSGTGGGWGSKGRGIWGGMRGGGLRPNTRMTVNSTPSLSSSPSFINASTGVGGGSAAIANFPVTHEGDHHLHKRSPSSEFRRLEYDERTRRLSSSPMTSSPLGLIDDETVGSNLKSRRQLSNSSALPISKTVDSSRWMQRSEVFLFDFGVIG